MRELMRSPWLPVLGVLLAATGIVGVAGQARADVTTDDAGSIVIYPKVVSDGTRDTLIQLSNRSNMPVFVHCFYVNTAGRCSATTEQRCRLDGDCPSGESCARTCDANDFDVLLTAQQPTMWRASTGRLASLTPGPCRIGQTCGCSIDVASGQQICPGLEAAPSNSPYTPAVGGEFEGELKCYQTDVNGFPIPGNAIKGTAILENVSNGQISEYNALTVSANADPVVGVNQGQDLQLNYSGGGAGEYNYCPSNLVFTHYGDQAVDAFTNATVSTEITLVPCTELIEERAPTPVTVSFLGFNEFEQRFSADAISFDCYFSRSLADIPSEGQPLFVAGAGQWWKTRITPSASNICLTGSSRGLTCASDADCPGFLTSPENNSLGCRPAPGVLGVVEEFHAIGGLAVGTAANNMHVEGQRSGFGDVIVVPSLQ
ncbi:MAG: hypothetical protein HY270_14800 [Deltaproteobacteria bacterium]|nr:hypothetical protein [Deltaproteobacteria bacterium]